MGKKKKENKVLLFAPYFPPRLRVGAIRPYRFAKYLNRLGWDVSVISIKHPGKELNPVQRDDLKGVSIYELEPPFDKTTSANKTSEKRKKQSSILHSISTWFDAQFPLDTWLPFFWSKKKEIIQIIDIVNPDIIWSTSDPWSGGYTIGKIASDMKIKWISDFRDPWTLCSVRFSEKGFLAKKADEKAEKWIAENSNYMTFTSTVTEKKYLDHYKSLKDKTATIYNSFDAETQKIEGFNNKASNSFNVLFLGSFRELSTAELIIKILSIVKEKDLKAYERLFIHSYGELIGDDLELSKNRGVFDRFIQRDKVPFSKVQNEISTVDLLLLSTHPDRDDIVPAKLMDYLLSEKQILSLVQNPEVSKILEETQSGKQFGTSDLDAAADYILSMIKNKNKDEKFEGIDSKEIMKYDAPQRALELSELLIKVIDND